MRKTYLAVVQGHWPKDLQKIDAPLSRDRLQSGEREAFVDEDSGKASVTLFRVIKYSKKNTLLQVRPKTGRMHQIRVHCQHAGYPIINDPKYNAWRTEGRMGLHAETLQFKLLSEDTPYQFQVAPDAAFTALLGDEQPENSHE